MEIKMIEAMGKIILDVQNIIYVLIAGWMGLRLAKFYFDREMRRAYLLAKDRVVNTILRSVSIILTSMWEIRNIRLWIETNQISEDNPQYQQQINQARQEIHKQIRESYFHLGQMGLYFGPRLVDLIAQLISDLNEIVNTNNFETFDDWDRFRRRRILPILKRAHKELKNTVFDRGVNIS